MLFTKNTRYKVKKNVKNIGKDKLQRSIKWLNV